MLMVGLISNYSLQLLSLTFYGAEWHKGPQTVACPPLRCRVCGGGCYATASAIDNSVVYLGVVWLRVPALIGSSRGGNVTSAGWMQVGPTLCHPIPIWHVSSRIGTASCLTATRGLPFLLPHGSELCKNG